MNDTLPTDAYSRELDRLRSNPAGLETRKSTIEVKDLLGNTETWIVFTVRTEKGRTAFVQRMGADGGTRFVLPPQVTAALLAQEQALMTAGRRRGARQAVATKREAGIPIGNPEALRRALRVKR